MSIDKIADELAGALTELESSLDKINELTINITEIPAPPFNEDKRAKFIENQFSSLGYETRKDDEGNIVAYLEKVENPVILSAHLDTVFDNEIIEVERDDPILKAPGVGDDSRGLANLLIIAELLLDTRFAPHVLFVATVGEEGRGDLRGVKHLFSTEIGEDACAFVSIDGTSSSRIIDQAIGSLRYRIYFDGPGGHSYGAFGTVNPCYALGQFMYSFSELSVTPGVLSTHSIGVIGGGSAINAIPEQVWVDIDLRSESNEELKSMRDQVQEIAECAVTEENDEREGEISLTIEEVGNRPAGKLDEGSELRKVVETVNQYFEIETNFAASSTDANVPLQKDIPSISVSGVEDAGRAHTQNEWIDASASSLLPIKRNLVLTAALVDQYKD